jgi:uncharacterized membrane protein
MQALILSIQQLIGNLHPALVHLPVGIFFVCCIYQFTPAAVAGTSSFGRFALWIGCIAALLSCISGLLLSGNNEYDESLVTTHQWLGISLFVFSVIMLVFEYRMQSIRLKRISYVLLFLLLMVTGHLGGSLTHGSDYLTDAWNVDSDAEGARKVIVNIDSANLYADLVQPVFQQKCYSCHGKNKQKGDLRLDKEPLMMKGGEDGIILVPGDPLKSDLVKRLELPRNHDDHMPPKEKPQLTEQDIRLIHWWVQTGASFTKRIHELERSSEIDRLLSFYMEDTGPSRPESIIPEKEVDKADAKDLEAVSRLGIVISPIAQNSNYLQMNCINADTLSYTNSKIFGELKRQLLWLRAGNRSVTDSVLLNIAQCTNITRLQLDGSAVTDAGMKHLAKLDSLEYLNIVGTSTSASGLSALKNLKALKIIYAYNTAIKKEDLASLKKLFPTTVIELGGFQVPTLVSDTTEVKIGK